MEFNKECCELGFPFEINEDHVIRLLIKVVKKN